MVGRARSHTLLCATLLVRSSGNGGLQPCGSSYAQVVALDLRLPWKEPTNACVTVTQYYLELAFVGSAGHHHDASAGGTGSASICGGEARVGNTSAAW